MNIAKGHFLSSYTFNDFIVICQKDMLLDDEWNRENKEHACIITIHNTVQEFIHLHTFSYHMHVLITQALGHES